MFGLDSCDVVYLKAKINKFKLPTATPAAAARTAAFHSNDMSDSTQAPLLQSSPQTPTRPQQQRNWRAVLLLATAGFLGPVVALLIGGRYSHCATVNTAASNSTDAYAHDQLAVGRGIGAWHRNAEWLADSAANLRQSWGLENLQFVQVADITVNADDSIIGQYSKAVIVATVQGEPPKRRQAGQSYMSTSRNHSLSAVLPLAAINRAAATLEAALGRRLFPVTLEVAALAGKASPLSPPFALYDVSSGHITLESAVFEQAMQLPGLPAGIAAFADALFSQLSRFAFIKGGRDLSQVAEVVISAAQAAVSVAIAYQVPIWFCVACPVVLGLLAPFVINGGLAVLASAACSHWQLPAEECNDLWYGVFAAGMVISLASAIPIVFICKLPQCARHKP